MPTNQCGANGDTHTVCLMGEANKRKSILIFVKCSISEIGFHSTLTHTVHIVQNPKPMLHMSVDVVPRLLLHLLLLLLMSMSQLCMHPPTIMLCGSIIFRICTLFNHTFYWNRTRCGDKDRTGKWLEVEKWGLLSCSRVVSSMALA